MSQIITVNDVLNSIDKWTPEDRVLLTRELKNKARQDLKILLAEIRVDNQEYSEEEIMADIDQAVKKVRARRARKD